VLRFKGASHPLDVSETETWRGPRGGSRLMTKADLIEEVSKLSSLTKKETELIVNTVFDNITDALAKGDKVELRGFGSFRIRHRNSRKGRNPKTGDSVSVPEKRVPFFKVGKRLRELVNT
jgi:integration host factor subunit beta